MARLTLIPLFLIVLYLFLWKDPVYVNEQINGVNLEAPRKDPGPNALLKIRDLGANWISVIPFGFIGDSTGLVHYNSDRQWWGERSEGIAAVIRNAHHVGLKVMVKPHVWVRGQGWPGDYLPATPESWKNWMDSYREYILLYTQIAIEENAEMICIGTEFRQTARLKPDFWRALIAEIRQSYSGKITYAANWDNTDHISFWDDLDYIGVDAYFPLSEERSPDISTLKKAWKEPVKDLKRLSQKWQKPVLFTEFGYRSTDYTFNGHWLNEQEKQPVNFEAQSNAYDAVFKTVWNEPWMAGGFLWKWHMEIPERFRSRMDSEYTPQDKPAESVIREAYSRKEK